MKKEKFVVKRSQIPTKFPLVSTIVFWLLLDKLNVGSFGMGVFWTVIVLLWVVSIIVFMQEKEVSITGLE